MRILLAFLLLPLLAKADLDQYKYPVPIDVHNIPIQNAMGLPVLFETALTTTSYASVGTIPLTGNDAGRQYRSICVYNPDATLSVYVCLGGSSSCSTNMLKVPPSLGLCLDNIYYGPLNQITTVWGKLSSAGAVTPLVQCY